MKKIETITSRQNNQIKELKKLSLKKYRLETGHFLVENFTIIKDALDAGQDFEMLFITQDYIDHYPDKFQYLEDNSQASYYVIDENVNQVFSTLDTPSGIAAVYSMAVKDILPSLPVIYLDNVKDPGNLGSIMRSALAFGFKNLVLGEGCVDVYNPKTIAAAKDTIFKLNVLEDDDGSWLQNNTRPIYVTSSHEGVNLQDLKSSDNFCLVLGSESHGVAEELIAKADQKIKIEMSGEVESLNVAIAGAIILYKLRQ